MARSVAELYSGIGSLRFQKLQPVWILWGNLVCAEQNVLAYDIAASMIEQVIFLDTPFAADEAVNA